MSTNTGGRYRTLDVGPTCQAAQAAQAQPTEAEIAEILLFRSQAINPTQFAFRSVGTIISAYVGQRPGCRGQSGGLQAEAENSDCRWNCDLQAARPGGGEIAKSQNNPVAGGDSVW